MTEKKRSLVENRLGAFLRSTSFRSPQDYLDHLESRATEEELLVFFDLLSTNVTSFFRDPHHFDYLEKEFYQTLAREGSTTRNQRIRIWSAACSTGQEPYSIAMQALECLPDLPSRDFRVLGSDLSNYAVSCARSGVFQSSEGLSAHRRATHTVPSQGGFQVRPSVRALVTIARINLMGEWPFKGPFDVIFCRNVMIYFDAPTRSRLINRFAQYLRPGGRLIVGSAETLAGIDAPFSAARASIYQRI